MQWPVVHLDSSHLNLILSEISIRNEMKKKKTRNTAIFIIMIYLPTLFCGPKLALPHPYPVCSSLRQWNLICLRNDAHAASDNYSGYNDGRAVVRRGRPYRFPPASVWLTRACSPLSYNAPIILERSWEGRNNSVITSGTSPEEQRSMIANGRKTDKRCRANGSARFSK